MCESEWLCCTFTLYALTCCKIKTPLLRNKDSSRVCVYIPSLAASHDR